MIRKYFKQIVPYALPGLLVGGLFLAYTLFFSLSFSYMGNSAGSSLSSMARLFIWDFLKAVAKILAAYVVVFSILGIFFSFAVRGFYSFFNRTPGKASHTVISSILIVLFSFAAFCRDLVLYPQLYLDSFYLKNGAFASFQEALTNHLSPAIFGCAEILLLAGGLSCIIAGYGEEILCRCSRPHARKISAGVVLVAIIVFCASLFRNEPTTASHIGKKNVLVLASDALRPDHFSWYGYGRETTPNLDRLFREGLVAKNIYTVIPRTFPSWTSILTSQYPETHGIRNMFPSSATRNRAFTTLPSVLSSEGYHTAVCGDFAADVFPRIDFGFSSVRPPTFNSKIMIEQIAVKSNLFLLPFLTNRGGMRFFEGIREFADFADPSYVVSEIDDEIDSASREGKPFFVVSFFSITHFPYSAPYPYYKRFTDSAYGGPSKYLKNRIISIGSNGGDETLSDRDIAHVRDLYDGCLYGFDEAAGKVIEHLKKQHLLENTILVVLSDHGENLYEDGNGMGHGEHLRGCYSQKIPFCVSGGGISPRVVNDVQSTIDIAPTILSILGEKIPASFEGDVIGEKKRRPFDAYSETGLWFDTGGSFFFQKKRLGYPDVTGVSAVEFQYRSEIAERETYFNFTNVAKHRSIIRGGYKLVYMPEEKGCEYELYDIAHDPSESVNVIAAHHDIADKLRKLLFDAALSHPLMTSSNGFLIPDPVPTE
jgi:arylsulfatase A-like enzyme